MRTAFSLACVLMTISLASFSISVTLFRRQWGRFFKHHGTHGRFLHIVPNMEDDDTDQATAFLYIKRPSDSDLLRVHSSPRARQRSLESKPSPQCPTPAFWYYVSGHCTRLHVCNLVTIISNVPVPCAEIRLCRCITSRLQFTPFLSGVQSPRFLSDTLYRDVRLFVVVTLPVFNRER